MINSFSFHVTMDQVSSKIVHDTNGCKKLVNYNPTFGKITAQTVREEEEYMGVI